MSILRFMYVFYLNNFVDLRDIIKLLNRIVVGRNKCGSFLHYYKFRRNQFQNFKKDIC